MTESDEDLHEIKRFELQFKDCQQMGKSEPLLLSADQTR